MNVLLIGSGGREHALAWKIAQSPLVEKIIAAPGNPGISNTPKCVCVPVGVNDRAGQRSLIAEHGVSLVVVGPEDPLAAGITDDLSAPGCLVFGPSAKAAQLEASKEFAKSFMLRHNIPTAKYAAFTEAEAALAYVRQHGAPIVIKADGLAAGKGVTVAATLEEAEAAVREILVDQTFGDAGAKVVIEECMQGEEASLLTFCDGNICIPMASAQDHKRALDGDQGPNTGGMGAYSPAPVLTPELLARVQREILDPAVKGMAAEGIPYKGVLYAGLMITADGPKVVEFNCRFGDPETQVVLPRLSSDIVPIFTACVEGTLSPALVQFDGGPCLTVVMASPGYPKAYPKGIALGGIAEAEAIPGVQVFHAGTELSPEGALRSNGGRVLNVTATAADLATALKSAYDAVERIEFPEAHFRRDIAHRALKSA